MSTLAIASILEELRCMDGELFKAEICQRLFIWLKSQANETLESVFGRSSTEYAKVLEAYRAWPTEVAKEELLALQEKAGGAEELQSAWVAVSLHWVRLNKKSDSAGKTSIKIKTPDPRDLLKNFFVSLCSKSWCTRGDLWTMDPVKQDFVFREVFRQSVGNSIHFLQESTLETEFGQSQTTHKARESESVSESAFKRKQSHSEQLNLPVEHFEKESAKVSKPEKLKLQEEVETEQDRTDQNRPEKNGTESGTVQSGTVQSGTEQSLEKRLSEESEQGHLQEKQKHKDADTENAIQKEKEEPETESNETKAVNDREAAQEVKEEEEDDIGPDDSVSQFFSGAKEHARFPTQPQLPPKRYADAGTVMYSSAPRRVLVKPITLKLENPVQKIDE